MEYCGVKYNFESLLWFSRLTTTCSFNSSYYLSRIYLKLKCFFLTWWWRHTKRYIEIIINKRYGWFHYWFYPLLTYLVNWWHDFLLNKYFKFRILKAFFSAVISTYSKCLSWVLMSCVLNCKLEHFLLWQLIKLVIAIPQPRYLLLTTPMWFSS